MPGETRTNLKVIDPENHTNTDINEPGIEVDAPELTALLYDLLKELKQGDIVVLAGSLPKGAPKDTYYTWVESCKKAGAKVFLDADGELLAEAEGCSLSGQTQQRRAFPHDGPGAENAG